MHRFRSAGVPATLIATLALMLLSPAHASADGSDLRLTFADPAYAFAHGCNAADPIVFVNVVLRNDGTEPSAATSVTAADDRGTLGGSVAVPSIDAGTQLTLVLGLTHAGGGPVSDVAGDHALTLAVDDRTSDAPALAIPAGLCGAAPPGGGGGKVSAKARARPASPVLAESATAQSTIGAAIVASLTVASPANIRSASGARECAAHAGPLGALLCPDLVRSGHVLLVWDWRPGAGPDDIDGYRVYRVDGNAKLRVATQANKEAVTLADVPPPAGGYGGACYAVTAYAGARESAPSSAFCAGQGSAATLARLSATQVRSHTDVTSNINSFSSNDANLWVGINYGSSTHLLGDLYSNDITRGALLFDISRLRGRTLVDAKLIVRIASSSGAGPVHSCATTIGRGITYWWQNQEAIDGDFAGGVRATDTGPDVVTDVQPIVARWMRGEPNYGFVLRNDDENPGAFTNLKCVTKYFDPVLEITYY